MAEQSQRFTGRQRGIGHDHPFTFPGAAVPLVRVRAASDLDCPDAEIRISEELGNRYKAVGCGRKMLYRTACDGLSCVVQSENEPGIPWKDRPEPSR